MQINPYKLVLISTENAILVPKNLALLNGDLIPTIPFRDTIKYLDVNFNEYIIFYDKSFLSSRERFQKSYISQQSDQKLNILDQYV